MAAVLPTWSFHDAQGDRLCETDLTQLWEGVGPCLGVTRAHLQRLLVERASGVRCRLGVAVTGVAQAQDSVTVGFAQGAPQRYDLVVGADGRHSTTRRLALGATAAQYAGTMAWRSVAPFRPDGLHHLQLYLGDGCFFGLVPVGENGTYGFAGLVSERFEDPAAGRLDRFRQRFAGFARPVEEYLAALGPGDPLHSAPIEWVNPEHWHVGRVVVVGDAAHAAPPHMGEGGSLALEDGLVLAQVLSQATEVDTALRMYEARRRPRVGWVQEQSLAAAKAWGMPPPLETTSCGNAATRCCGSVTSRCVPTPRPARADPEDAADAPRVPGALR